MRYETNYLQHHGVNGMKWGIRNYQNKDGTLTEAGKRRYDRDIQDNLSKKKDNRIDTSKPNPRRWVSEDLKRTKATTDATSRMVKEASKIEQQTRSTKKNTPSKKDLSSMTDKELRDSVNRAMLERQYAALYAEQHPVAQSKGRTYVKETLEVTGTVLGIAGSALSLAIAINELKK